MQVLVGAELVATVPALFLQRLVGVLILEKRLFIAFDGLPGFLVIWGQRIEPVGRVIVEAGTEPGIGLAIIAIGHGGAQFINGPVEFVQQRRRVLPAPVAAFADQA